MDFKLLGKKKAHLISGVEMTTVGVRGKNKELDHYLASYTKAISRLYVKNKTVRAYIL